MRPIACSFACLLLIAAGPCYAAAKDCSNDAIAAKPLGGSVQGKPFAAKSIHIDFTKDGMRIDGAAFDRYVLHLESNGIFNEFNIDMLVPSGKKPDGRTFRVLPVDSIGAQPSVVQGVPEVQGWELELDDQGVDASFTQDTAAIRVELGQRKGAALAGKIHVCVPSQNAEIEGSFTATMAP